MIALTDLIATRRPTTGEVSNLTRLQTEGQPNEAQEILGQLRAALAGLENLVGNDNACGPQLQKQMRDCEMLHQEAMKAVRASAPCARSSFRRRMTAQAALSGLCFA